MTLNEKLVQILELTEDDRRRESVERAEKKKPKYVSRLMDQVKKGRADGIIIDDDDLVFRNHLHDYFSKEGFHVATPELGRLLITVAR